MLKDDLKSKKARRLRMKIKLCQIDIRKYEKNMEKNANLLNNLEISVDTSFDDEASESF